jgi:hypothetical protein
MKLTYGEVVDVFLEDGMRFGRVRTGGAMKKASLELVAGLERGDRVLLCDGIAIARLEIETTQESPCASQSPVN